MQATLCSCLERAADTVRVAKRHFLSYPIGGGQVIKVVAFNAEDIRFELSHPGQLLCLAAFSCARHPENKANCDHY